MYTLLIPEVEFWIEMSFWWVGQGCFNGDDQGARIIVFSAYQGEDFYSHSGFLRITNVRIFTHQKHWAEIFGIFAGLATECKNLWVFWKRSGWSVFLWYPSDSCCVSWEKSGFCFGTHNALHQGIPLEWGCSLEWGLALGVLISGTPCSSGRAALKWCFAYGLFCFFWILLHSRMEGSCGGSTRPNLGWGRCQDLLSTRPVCKIHMTTWPCSKSTWKPWGKGVCWV